tara:strand:+ start:421 stop:696 length:276 start_codon:yes stop_codon:yes gene_type:complete
MLRNLWRERIEDLENWEDEHVIEICLLELSFKVLRDNDNGNGYDWKNKTKHDYRDTIVRLLKEGKYSDDLKNNISMLIDMLIGFSEYDKRD